MANFGLFLDATLPYVAMILCQLFLALFLTLLQFVFTDGGVSSIVLVVYQQIVSSILLAVIALIFERDKRPPLSFHVLSSAFFIGLLQIPLGELMLTASLRYITATFQSIGLNLVPLVVFVLAVFTRREVFRFGSLNGQAKLLGVAASSAGGVVLVACSDPGLAAAGGRVVGYVMVGLAVVAVAVAMLLMERLALKYPADLTLTATITVFGTLQTLIVAALIERNPSSWTINWSNNFQLLAIIYGGFITSGLIFFARVWCVHKKGPVFAAAFSPLLVVFSFLLQKNVFGNAVQLSSVIGALLVISGLYLLLWAKYRDYETRIEMEITEDSYESYENKPLVLNTT